MTGMLNIVDAATVKLEEDMTVDGKKSQCAIKCIVEEVSYTMWNSVKRHTLEGHQ